MLGHISHLMWSFDQMNPTFISIRKVPLSPASCVDLSLYHKAVARKRSRDRLRLLWSPSHCSTRYRYPGGGKKISGLVFVNIHKEEKLIEGRVVERAV
jgi:hypothetical protein